MKDKKFEKTTKGLWKEFRTFITRGNVLDMAVGVIMGSAFGAIVTALVNILLSVCTWAVPGGIKGLVTILPAVNSAQAGVDGIGQTFTAAQLSDMTVAYAKSMGATITVNDASFATWQTNLLSKYTLHGTNYYYNGSAIIDWGTFINAIISFLIIALVLFIIVKIVSILKAKNDEFKAKELEAYYQRHPEERPVPPEPGKPVDSPEVALLKEIRDSLKNTPQVK